MKTTQNYTDKPYSATYLQTLADDLNCLANDHERCGGKFRDVDALKRAVSLVRMIEFESSLGVGE